MAQNLVESIIGMATPAIVERVAAALGINPDLARKALTAALPVILGAVASRASTPTGATQLFNAVSKFHAPADLSHSLSGASAAKFSSAGSDMMNSLIGGKETSSLVEVISQFSGVSGNAGSGLVGLGTQMVMGQLAKARSGSGLDANGLASLLSSQQGAIQSALPAGLSSLLASTGSFGHAFSKATGAASSAAASAIPPKPAVASGAPRNSVGSNFLMWLIPVVLIAAAAWYYMAGSKAPEPAPAPAATTEQPATQAPAATTEQPATPETAAAPAATDLTKSVLDGFTAATAALGSVTDATTAQAALPAISSLQKLLDGSSAITATMTAEQKAALSTGLQPAIAAFKAAAEKAIALPGVGDVLKPVVDALLAKAATITG